MELFMFYWKIAILNDHLFISNSCNCTGLGFTLYWEQEYIWKTDILKIFAKQAREVRSVYLSVCLSVCLSVGRVRHNSR